MPTYGTFMMARFCSAAGFGGALPAASRFFSLLIDFYLAKVFLTKTKKTFPLLFFNSYICEITTSNRRGRLLAGVGALGAIGGVFAIILAEMIIPETGQMVILENKEHFSAWHRYLLLCTLPTIVSILGLFWLPESPRYLLENGREVEALQIYQKIYRSNRIRGGYSLTELELPGTRHRHNTPPSVLDGMAQTMHLFFYGFVQIFKSSMFQTTMALMLTWGLVIFVYHGLTIYVTEFSKRVKIDEYNNETVSEE